MITNMFKIALKEFDNLISNKFIIIIISAYVIMLFIFSYTYSYITNNAGAIHSTDMNLGGSIFLDVLAMLLMWFGSVIAAIIGFGSISIERKSHTLDTLAAKPVYRDTIINGKLIGSALFLGFISLFISALFYVEWMLFMGNVIDIPLNSFLFAAVVVLVITWLCQLIFLSTAILLTIILKDDIFALFASIFTYIIMIMYIPNVTFSASIGYILGDSWSDFLASLSPYNLAHGIIDHTTRPYGDPLGDFPNYAPAVFVLLLYLIVAVLLSYIAFTKRDEV